MNTEEQDIELLARAIMVEARDGAERLHAEAKEKAEAIRKRAQEQAESERKVILTRAREDAERLRGQSSATSQLKARSVQLEQREKILNDVFEAARKQLGAAGKGSNFAALANMLAREALSELKATEAEIRADAATQKALNLNDLAREFGGTFSFGKPLEEGTGVVVSAAGGKLHYNNTLETRLERLHASLRSSVYKVLMGEDV